HIYAIYGFVRFANDIVDSFEDYSKKYLLKKFREDTFDAMEHKISLNPVLNSFQHTVHKYKISYDLITTFLDSMEMDLNKLEYNEEKYNLYILGSAEVVGLMCLHVFTEGNKKQFEELKPYAMKLGAAFQKVNFLRDLKDDYHVLGRTYFPNVDMRYFTKEVKNQIEADIANDFKVALIGINKLPTSSKIGVYLAYVYYLSLFRKIKKLPIQNIMHERIRINNGKKIGLLLNILFLNKMRLN
ncbi:MAG: phytoene/squalene synthase family protein, partial [Bacteroidia bacterium]